MVRILLVAPTDQPRPKEAGGVSIRMHAYSAQAREAGHIVTPFTVEGGQLLRYTSALIPSAMVDCPSMYTMIKLKAAMKECDVVVCTDMVSSCIAACMARACNKPFLYSVHTNYGEAIKFHAVPMVAAIFGPGADLYGKVCSKVSTCTYTTSTTFMGMLRGAGWKATNHYQPPPITGITDNAAAMTPEQIQEYRMRMSDGVPNRTIMVFCGRFESEKRINLLRDSVPPGATLCVIGDGKLGAEMEASWHNPAGGPKAGGVVILRGMVPRDKLGMYYRAADWVVSASAFETFGNTSYEGNSCGTPCILHNGGGQIDQIVPGTEGNGALVDFDLPCEKLRAEMATLISPKNTPSEAAVLKVAYTNKVKGHTFVQAVEQTVQDGKGQYVAGPVLQILFTIMATLATVFSYLIIYGGDNLYRTITACSAKRAEAKAAAEKAQEKVKAKAEEVKAKSKAISRKVEKSAKESGLKIKLAVNELQQDTGIRLRRAVDAVSPRSTPKSKRETSPTSVATPRVGTAAR